MTRVLCIGRNGLVHLKVGHDGENGIPSKVCIHAAKVPDRILYCNRKDSFLEQENLGIIYMVILLYLHTIILLSIPKLAPLRMHFVSS